MTTRPGNQEASYMSGVAGESISGCDSRWLTRPRTRRLRVLTVALGLAWIAMLTGGLSSRAGAAVSFEDFSLPVNDFPQGIWSGDCNDDAVTDLLVADQGSDDVTILRNIGGGKFAFLTSVPITAAPRAAVCADFN